MKKFLLVFLFLSLINFTAYAAEPDATNTVVELKYNVVNKELKNLEDILKSGKISSEMMPARSKFLVDTKNILNEQKKQIEKDLKAAQKRIDVLGEEPKTGEKEPEVVAAKRKEFVKELSVLKGKATEVDLLIAKIEEIEVLMLNIHNKEILGNLLNKQTPLIYPSVFLHANALFVEFVYDIIKSPYDWYQGLSHDEQIKVKASFLPFAFMVFIASWFGIYLRLFIMRNFGYRKEIEHPRYGKKVMAAAFVALAYGVIPATILGSFLLWILSTQTSNIGFFGLVVNSVLFYALIVILAKAISRVIFAPYNEKWRLVSVSDEKAKKITSSLYFAVITIGIAAFCQHIARKANYPIELITYLSTLGSAIKAFFIVLVTKRMLWEDEVNSDAENDEEENEQHEENEESISSAFKVTFTLSVFAIGVLILSLFGYSILSSFILNKFIESCLLIGLFVIIRKAFIEVLHRLLLLRFWAKTFKFRRKLIHKIDFWLTMIFEPLFVIFGVFILFSLWGVSTDLLLQMLKKLLFGFMIGDVKISLLAIVLGFVVFFIAVAVVRSLKRKLMSNVLMKMDIDDGIKHSLESGFGFIGFLASVLLAIVVMGGNLTNLALIAGALSFGIGLGLQNIVNNFVSGIILLFERPIKVGDWVIVNGQEGIVKQINIRATELETWKKSNIIIPNADMLSNTLTNMTHTDKMGRVEISIGVAYGSDVELVKELLLAAVDGNKKILKKPAPSVFFMDFGDSSLEFEARGFTADVMNKLGIESELRFEINKRFAEHNINIPFPQRTLHLDKTAIEALSLGKK